MAQKVLVQLVDDLDGTVSEDVETVQFALDGVTYEIDLSESNADRLRAAFGEVVPHARRTGGRIRRRRPATVGAADGEAARIRAWADANGVQLAARGRIPRDVQEQYDKAQAAPNRKRRPAGRKTRRG